MSLTSITLDDTVEGKILSEAPGSKEGQVTFIGPAQSSIMLGGGFEITFHGGVFRTSNEELIAALTRLSKRGTGIHKLETVAAVAAAKDADPLKQLADESKQEAADAAKAKAVADAAKK
jgi:hypothetical protein